MRKYECLFLCISIFIISLSFSSVTHAHLKKIIEHHGGGGCPFGCPSGGGGGSASGSISGSGSASGESSGEVSGSGSGQSSGEISGSGSGQSSGEISGSGSGQSSGEISGSGSGQSSGEISGSGSGQSSGEISGSGQSSGSMSGSGQSSGSVSGSGSGQSSGEISGSGKGESSGEVSGSGSGKSESSGEVSGSGSGKSESSGEVSGSGSGKSESSGSISGSGSGSSQGSGEVSGSGSGSTQGSGEVSGSGSGSSQGSGEVSGSGSGSSQSSGEVSGSGSGKSESSGEVSGSGSGKSESSGEVSGSGSGSGSGSVTGSGSGSGSGSATMTTQGGASSGGNMEQGSSGQGSQESSAQGGAQGEASAQGGAQGEASAQGGAQGEASAQGGGEASGSASASGESSFSANKEYKGCFNKVYAFGDSFTDTGNADALKGLKSFIGSIVAKKLQGHRLSNGKLMIDFLCDSLGLPSLQAYKEASSNFSSGANFAVAGSTCLKSDFFARQKIPNTLMWSQKPQNVLTQVDWFNTYLKNTACKGMDDVACKTHLQGSLFWLGAIGFSDYARMFGAALSGQSITQVSVDHVTKFLKAFLERGAKFLVVQGLPPAGCCPLQLFLNALKGRDEMGCSPIINSMIKAHNELLQKKIEEFRAQHTGCTIVYADTWKAFREIITNHKTYHFQEPFKSCCGAGGGLYNFNLHSLCGAKGTSACQNPQNYISWDGVHYTETMNKFLADLLFNKGYCTPSFDTLIKAKLSFKAEMSFSGKMGMKGQAGIGK